MAKKKTLSQEQTLANKAFSVSLTEVKGKRKANKAGKASRVTTTKADY